jgi:hypothetical protein
MTPNAAPPRSAYEAEVEQPNDAKLTVRGRSGVKKAPTVDLSPETLARAKATYHQAIMVNPDMTEEQKSLAALYALFEAARTASSSRLTLRGRD